MWAVETLRLCKSYGKIHSLVDCNLQIASGSVYGLLGPNGAGKTTLLRTLLGFLKPTSGSAAICNFPILSHGRQSRQQVSYLPGDARLIRSLRGRELLDMFSGLHPHGSLDGSLAVARRLDLELSRRVMFMSTGMRQKLAIAIVIGNQAPVVVLDEPTANLDPNVRREVVELVRDVRSQGRTVVLSSHIFSDIDDACDQVAILYQGRVVAVQEMSQLQQLHIVSGKLVVASEQLAAKWMCRLADVPFVQFNQSRQSEVDPRTRLVELHLTGPPQLWLNWLAGLELQELQIDRAGVRAIYQRYHRPVNAL